MAGQDTGEWANEASPQVSNNASRAFDMDGVEAGRSESSDRATSYNDIQRGLWSAGGFDQPAEKRELEAATSRLRRMGRFEAQDFNFRDSDLDVHTYAGRTKGDYTKMLTWSWMASGITGVAMGILGFLLELAISNAIEGKLRLFQSLIDERGGLAAPLLALLGVNLGTILVAASMCIFIQPLAAGSGVPELKLFLNGVKIPGLFRVNTLLLKAGGVIFSISAGIVAGKEGPFIHSGAALGSLISRAIARAFRAPIDVFTTPESHKDFVAIGSAAGVATAFGSPVGGLLFMIEETLSYYRTATMWRSFLAASVSVFTLKLLENLYEHNSGSVSHMMGTHRFFGLYADPVARYGGNLFYFYWEMPLFVGVGLVAALLGAAFITVNVKVLKLRLKYFTGRRTWRRLIEALFVVALTTVVFVCAAYGDECGSLPEDAVEVEKEDFFHRLWCDNGEYSKLGSLLVNPIADTLRGAIHLGERGGMEFAFDDGSLAAAGGLFFAFLCVTHGLPVPQGVFLPSMLLGGIFGRLAAQGLRTGLIDAGVAEDNLPSVHAWGIIGAAATFASIKRMTLSATVLMMETTGALQLVVPIMVAVFAAKFAGEWLILGIEDIYIKARGGPILDEPFSNMEHMLMGLKTLTSDVMVPSSAMVTLSPQPRVSEVVDALQGTHNVFPVTNHKHHEPVHVAGVVSRDLLLLLLKHNIGIFREGETPPETIPSTQAEREEVRRLIEGHPEMRLHTASTLSSLPSYLVSSCRLNIEPFMERQILTLCGEAPLGRAYNLLRSLGAHHLFVTPSVQPVMGMVTRKDISAENVYTTLSQRGVRATAWNRANTVHFKRYPDGLLRRRSETEFERMGSLFG